MAHQRPTTPVHRDVREQPVLDLIPLARARREVADGDLQARLVSKRLKFYLPEPDPVPIAPAPVGADQQATGLRIDLLPHPGPPLADALDGEAGRVVVDADVDPAQVPPEVVDAVGDRLADARVREVVDPYLLRVPLGLPLPSAILEVADQFLLLGVDGDDGPTGCEVAATGLADVAELGVTVGALLPLVCLGVGLEAVAEVVEQLAGDAVADGESSPGQSLGQLARALAGPPQGGHGIAPRLGGDQLLQRGEDRRAPVADLLAAPTRPPDVAGGGRRRVELLQGPADRRMGDPRGPAHATDAAMAERAGLGGGEESPLPLIEVRQDRGELALQFRVV